ncbi:MAG: cyclic nucleotide-binding domain-containing protein [Fusobacteriaceae bacterium]
MDTNFQSIKGILLKIPILGAMTETEIKFLMALFVPATYEKDEIIIEEGGSPNNLYIIKSGEVSVLKNSIELTKLGLGDSFGEVELIGIIPNLADCVALTPCEILVLPKKNLYNLKKSNPEFFIKLILNIARECCRRLANADNFIVHNIDSQPQQDKEYY